MENKIPIEILNLSVRSHNVLKRNKIDTVGQLMEFDEEKLSGLKNLGKQSVDEIMNVLIILNNEDSMIGHPVPEMYQKMIDNPKGYLLEDGKVERKLVAPTKVLHFLDDTTTIKDFSIIMFYDNSGALREHLDILDLNLSNRASGSLMRHNIKTAKELISMEYAELKKVKGLGQGAIDEIIDKLKFIISISYSENLNIAEIDKYADIIVKDILERCPDIKQDKVQPTIKACLIQNIAKFENVDDVEEIIHDKDLMNVIYSDDFLKKFFSTYISTKLFKGGIIPLFTLKLLLPEGLCSSDVLMQTINDMVAKNRIEYTENGLRYHLLMVMDYVKLMEDGNQKTALLNRLNGLTLEETGQIIGVTRERVRQLAKKGIEKLPKLREDDFKYWFENYDLSEEECCHIFEIPVQSYNYLDMSYKKGIKNMELMLEDKKIAVPMAQRVTKEIYKNCILVEGEYVLIKRDELIKNLLRIYYSDNECTLQEFYEFYNEFLKTNGLDNDEKLLFPSERAFDARIPEKNFTLLKYGKRIRYYDVDGLDADKFFEELKLDRYKNLEISTLRIFNDNLELMQEYDIHDEYELHNLFKKRGDRLEQYDISLRRMPFIGFGYTNRVKQVIDLLEQLAPINNDEFAEFYEEEYGVLARTVLANFVGCIDKYLYNGIYTMDHKELPIAQYNEMKRQLTEEYYFLEDVRAMYKDIFPDGDVSCINSYTLKTIGYRVYTNYIITNKYPSSESYFRELFTGEGVVDTTKFDKRLKYNQSYYHVLWGLRDSYRILEFENGKFLTIERFMRTSNGITVDDLKKYASDATNFADEEYFTIKTLRDKGFTSIIDDLGFDDFFYSFLIERNSDTITSSRTGGSILFRKSESKVTRQKFFKYLMKKFRKIDIIKFMDYIKDVYGLEFEKWNITSLADGAGMYYDDIMEKLYINREEYYEDI